MAKKEWSVSVPAHGYVEFVVKASSAQEAIDLVEQGEFEEGLTEYGLEYDFEDAAAGHRIKLPRLKRNGSKSHFWDYEITDTYAGEANYSWVDRGALKATTNAGAVRELKAIMGITGEPAEVSNFGDMISVKSKKRAIIGFATWADK